MERINVHQYDGPHESCPDPSRCDCECRGCKKVWFAAGRPNASNEGAETVAKVGQPEGRKSSPPWFTPEQAQARAELFEALGITGARPDGEPTPWGGKNEPQPSEETEEALLAKYG